MRRDPLTSTVHVPGDQAIRERLGVDLPRDLRNRDRQNQTASGGPPLVIVPQGTIGPWFREDVGSAGDASYTTRMMVPSAAATYATATGIGYRAPRAGIVTVGYLWSSAARSGGSCTLRVRITDAVGSTDYDLTDCVLDGAAHPDGDYTRDQRVSQEIDLADGIPYAAGDLIDTRFVTAGTFTPNTADLGAQIVLCRLARLARGLV